MVKNLKFLLLAAILLFASVALAKSSGVEDGEENDRRKDLGEGERESKGIEGSGFRAFKVNRFTDAGNDTIVFSFRAFPVPRVRVRYFDGEIDDIDVENNDIEEKLELIAAIPGWFVYTEGDNEPGFNATTDTITQKFSLRRQNGNAWAVPVLDSVVVDGVQVFKLTVSRKTGDFAFVSYVANDTVNYEGFDLVADAIKFNVIALPGATTGLVLTADERLAVVVKVHFASGVELQDRSDENEERARLGQPELNNDVLIASADSDVSAYFNWEKTVTVYYEDQTSQVLDLVSTIVSAQELNFDRPPSFGVGTFDGGNSISGGDGGKNSSFGGDGGKNSTSGGSGSGGSGSGKEEYPDYPEPNKEHGDFNESSEESDDEREEKDNRGSYSSGEQDGAISGRLDNDQIFVFAIDGSLATATEVVWDPDSGATIVAPTAVTDAPTAAPTTATTTGSGSGAESASITIVKVLVAIFAIVAVLM